LTNDHRCGRSKGEEASLDPSNYFNDHYFSYEQVVTQSEQIRYVINSGKQKILEIGKGNGFVSDFLKKAKREVITFDLNANLAPDVCGDIMDLNKIFKKNEFEFVLCAEVLEHLPFSSCEQAIRDISQITSECALITLPRAQKTILDFQFILKVPKMRYKEGGIYWSKGKQPVLREHHWELDSSDETSLKKVKAIINLYFSAMEIRRIRYCPHHYFFNLKI